MYFSHFQNRRSARALDNAAEILKGDPHRDYTSKLVPQPQDRLTLGFSM